MTERILDLAEEPARLKVQTGVLVIERQEKESVTVPLCDLAVLVVSHPQVTYTQAVISGLVSQGGIFVACNEKHLPVGMILPLENHSIQSERFAQQAAATAPLKKRLWQQVARAKVRAQGRLLQELFDNDYGLQALANEVLSGDTGNIEGRAARIYWPVLMENPRFTRRRDEEGPNSLFNYGYAVLRAIVARGTCAAGLHPSLGIHHHNRYDTFCLVDDLMEPLRPLVDRAVVKLLSGKASDDKVELDRQAKQVLIQALMERVEMEGEKRTVFDAAHRMAASLADAFAGEGKKLTIPEA